jgi:hypothetical protein
MNFGIQLLISFGLAALIGILIFSYAKKRWMIQDSRNADYWIIPFGLLITTIGWLPFLFNKSIEFSMKFEVLGVMYLAGLIYWFVLKPPRKNIK